MSYIEYVRKYSVVCHRVFDNEYVREYWKITNKRFGTRKNGLHEHRAWCEPEAKRGNIADAVDEYLRGDAASLDAESFSPRQGRYRD